MGGAAPRGRASLFLLAGVLALLPGCRGRQARPLAPDHRDVAYGEAGGRRLLLDVYGCPGAGRHPAALLVHGGGWQTGDKGAEAGVARLLTSRGLVCFAVNYRLAPRHFFPAQVEDCARAVRWLRAHAAEYQVDPQRVGAWGDSAGAHLALMLGAMPPGGFLSADDPNRAQSAQVQAVVDLYGPADFRDANAWPLRTLYIARAFFGGGFNSETVRAQASPTAYVSPRSAPVLLLHGDSDPIVPVQQSQDLKAALDAARVPSQLTIVPGAGHNLDGTPPAELARLLGQAADWLAQTLGARAPVPAAGRP